MYSAKRGSLRKAAMSSAECHCEMLTTLLPSPPTTTDDESEPGCLLKKVRVPSASTFARSCCLPGLAVKTLIKVTAVDMACLRLSLVAEAVVASAIVTILKTKAMPATERLCEKI